MGVGWGGELSAPSWQVGMFSRVWAPWGYAPGETLQLYVLVLHPRPDS